MERLVGIKATPEEWALARQSLGQSVAHVGGQLAQVGMPGVSGAMKMLEALLALDVRIEKALSSA